MPADPNELFIRAVQDLDTRVIGDADSYELLRASALLRQLLLDDHPLADQANRSTRLKIEYEVIDVVPELPRPDDELFYLWATDLYPPLHPGRPTVRLSRDRLLSRPVIHLDGSEISVRQVILEAANAQGGVHAPGTMATTPALEAWDNSLRLHKHRPVIGLLRGIGLVVIAGLRPLVVRLQSDAQVAEAGGFEER